MKTILVTGGAGFLGSNLIKKLLRDNNKVICLDSLLTGRETNIKSFFSNPNFEFIKHDIINPIDIKVDQIYNLACPASPPFYQLDPIHTLKTSILGSINMLNLAKKYNARILQASTSEVYGDPKVHPQIETYKGNVNPNGIRACYDEGKRAAETLFFDYHRLHNVDIRVIRIFNTYGPNMNPKDGRVVSNFIVQALNNIDITIYGSGNQTRSFCYVDDLIDGMILMMNNNTGFLGPVNLGNPSEFTMLELARLIIDMTKSKSKIVFKELPKDDPERRKPNIDLANNKLGWRPKININEGLSKTINYFKNN